MEENKIEESKKSNKLIYIVIAVVVLAICACAVYFIFLKKDNNETNITPTNNNTPAKQVKTYEVGGYKYEVPDGMNYENEENGTFMVDMNDSSISVSVTYVLDRNGTLIDGIYEKFNQEPRTNNFDTSKEQLSGKEVVAIKSKGEPQVTYFFIGHDNVAFSIFVSYEENKYNVESILPIIKSLSKPVK